MKKSDLKDGMILVTRARGNGILLAGRLKGSHHLANYEGKLNIDDLNEDLILENDYAYSIDAIYEIKSAYGYSLGEIIDNLPKDAVELIWERKREIDWSKVPKWTPVQVSDWGNDFEGKDFLIKYEPELREFPFIIVGNFDENAVSYKYCRIHPDIVIKEEWYK